MNRRWIAALSPMLLSLTLVASLSARAQDIKVTLLGTGTPAPAMNRFGPSTLVEAGGRKFLFDAGRGALQRLAQAKVPWRDVDGIFLTHLHSDHVVGFVDLWLIGWLVGERDRPLRVWGPSGTKPMVSHLVAAHEFDIRIRRLDDGASADGVVVVAEEISESVVYDQDGLRVTAFDVDHGPVSPAFGYRVDYRGRSVVLSGDTRASENLIRHAEGIDLLVHEVVSPESYERAGVSAARARSRIGHHTTPQQAGAVFARAKPRLAVYSHIGPPSTTAIDLIAPTRTTYSGPLEVGEDLMVIEVGEAVEVRRPVRSSP